MDRLKLDHLTTDPPVDRRQLNNTNNIYKLPQPKSSCLIAQANRVGYNGRSHVPLSHKQLGGWTTWRVKGRRDYFIQEAEEELSFNKESLWSTTGSWMANLKGSEGLSAMLRGMLQHFPDSWRREWEKLGPLNTHKEGG